jgi:hypothetical protein
VAISSFILDPPTVRKHYVYRILLPLGNRYYVYIFSFVLKVQVPFGLQSANEYYHQLRSIESIAAITCSMEEFSQSTNAMSLLVR